MSKVHAEIAYTRKDGMTIHSDICPADCDPQGIIEKDYRDILHACLDEWLDNSKGTGGFYIKNENYEIEKK